MKESENSGSGTGLTATQEFLRQLWEDHVRYEFAAHNTEDTLATMVEDAYVNHIPVLTGVWARMNYGNFIPNVSFPGCRRIRK